MSSLGYNRPLYLLPFDHRQSYITGMFHFTPPLTADEHDIVADSKQVIYDGFRQALGSRRAETSRRNPGRRGIRHWLSSAMRSSTDT